MRPAPIPITPGRAHSLGGESPLHTRTRQREVLARGNGFADDCESEGSPKQSAGLTTRKRIRVCHNLYPRRVNSDPSRKEEAIENGDRPKLRGHPR